MWPRCPFPVRVCIHRPLFWAQPLRTTRSSMFLAHDAECLEDGRPPNTVTVTVHPDTPPTVQYLEPTYPLKHCFHPARFPSYLTVVHVRQEQDQEDEKLYSQNKFTESESDSSSSSSSSSTGVTSSTSTEGTSEVDDFPSARSYSMRPPTRLNATRLDQCLTTARFATLSVATGILLVGLSEQHQVGIMPYRVSHEKKKLNVAQIHETFPRQVPELPGVPMENKNFRVNLKTFIV